MKYQDKYVGSQEEIYAFIKELSTKFLRNSIVVENEIANIPDDRELEYKIKYENDEYEGALAIKISWTNAEEVEEIDEIDEEEEKE